MISHQYNIIYYDIIHDIRYDITVYALQRPILPRHSVRMKPTTIAILDFDEERDYADQGPFTDTDMEEDAVILTVLLKHMPSFIDTDDIEQLVQDIPVQLPLVVPVRTVQEAVAAGDLPPLDADASGSKTENT